MRLDEVTAHRPGGWGAYAAPLARSLTDFYMLNVKPQQFSDDLSDSEVYCFNCQKNIKQLCSVGFARE